MTDGIHLQPEDLYYRVRLVDGLEMFYLEQDISRHRLVHSQSQQTCLEFGCLLSGRLNGEAQLKNGERHFFSGETGQSWYAISPANSSTLEYLPGQTIRNLCFLAWGPMLNHFLPVGWQVADAYENDSGRPFSLIDSMTWDVERIAGQIVQKKESQSPLDRLFLISKAYELMFHLAGSGKAYENENSSNFARKGVDRAVYILQKNMASPPRLPEIARESGLCVTSLNDEFRKRFGTTVFGFLRRERLERARILISQEKMNVLEAAWNVGYSSLSSFHKAFYARYGITPGSCGRTNDSTVEKSPPCKPQKDKLKLPKIESY